MIQIKTDTDNRVIAIYYLDDKKDGWIEIDSIPDPEPQEGKIPVMYYEDGAITYRYEDAPEMPEPEVSLEEVKSAKLSEIEAYDKSEAVNGLTYEGRFLWLSREDRLALTDRFTRETAEGLEKTNLFYGGEAIEVTPQQGLILVQAVSSYADKCFDTTQRHLAAIRALQSVEDIKAYDYTKGYPQKLNL